MAKVDLQAFGYNQVHVSFNGALLVLKNGDRYDNTELLAKYPQYFKMSSDEIAPVVETEVTEEILTEQSSEVETEITEVTEEILTEQSSEVETEAPVVSKRKK
jgi:glutamine amidotransferase-like uncharacterized protein